MYDPDYVTCEIANCEEHIEQLLQKIKELQSLPIPDEEGEIVIYQDLLGKDED